MNFLSFLFSWVWVIFKINNTNKLIKDMKQTSRLICSMNMWYHIHKTNWLFVNCFLIISFCMWMCMYMSVVCIHVCGICLPVHGFRKQRKSQVSSSIPLHFYFFEARSLPDLEIMDFGYANSRQLILLSLPPPHSVIGTWRQ